MRNAVRPDSTPFLSGAIGVDVHPHLVLIDVDALGPLPGVSWNEAKRKLTVDGHERGLSKLFQPDSLIEWIGLHRVEQALISVPPDSLRAAPRGIFS
jgi:hypothetical protein